MKMKHMLPLSRIFFERFFLYISSGNLSMQSVTVHRFTIYNSYVRLLATNTKSEPMLREHLRSPTVSDRHETVLIVEACWKPRPEILYLWRYKSMVRISTTANGPVTDVKEYTIRWSGLYWTILHTYCGDYFLSLLLKLFDVYLKKWTTYCFLCFNRCYLQGFTRNLQNAGNLAVNYNHFLVEKGEKLWSIKIAFILDY